MNEQLMSVEQVAQMLQLSTVRIYQLLRQGKLKGGQIVPGGKWRIAKEDALEFLCRHK
jgi:excisionase family DNA binding protein